MKRLEIWKEYKNTFLLIWLKPTKTGIIIRAYKILIAQIIKHWYFNGNSLEKCKSLKNNNPKTTKSLHNTQ